MDFEDLLERAIAAFDDDHVAAEFRERYHAFTVDEYQDVNLLQQTLLDAWLGPRDDLCVVGDDYQSIYGFTGATPELPARRAGAVPERGGDPAGGELPLDAAGARARQPARAETRRRGEDASSRSDPQGRSRRCGRSRRPRPRLSTSSSGFAAAGCPLEEIAILCRTHARLADFEAVLAEAGIPHQGASLLARDAARRVLRTLEPSAPAEQVRSDRARPGLAPAPAGQARRARADETERPRAARPAGGGGRRHRRGVPGRARAPATATEATPGAASTCSPTTAPRASSSSSFSCPRLEEKELPSKRARTAWEIEEERRLLYVGLTRAKQGLAISWVGKPSRFLAELTPEAAVAEPPEGFEALKAWRLDRAPPGRRARVRRLPQLDARGDRGPPPAEPRGARLRPRRRPREARALRRGGSSRARRAGGRAAGSDRVVGARPGGAGRRGRAGQDRAAGSSRPSLISCSSTAPRRPVNVV